LVGIATFPLKYTNSAELQCIDIGDKVSLLSQYQPDKMRMFYVSIDGPANVFCDNHGVVKNASIPEWMLMKKHDAINCHAVRDAVSAGILRVGKEDSKTNLVDVLTKVIVGQKRLDFCFHLFC
jgi:hypothetical protein